MITFSTDFRPNAERALDTTLLQAARRAPAREEKTGGGGDAGYTVTPGLAHYGYQAHVTVDETHMLNYFVTKVSNLRLY